MTNDKTAGAVTAAMQQSRFRVQAPNSSPREILVIPLGEASDQLVGGLSGETYRNATFLPFTASGEPWRTNINDRHLDLVVIVGHVGENLAQVIAIGESCIARQVKISGVLIHKHADQVAALSGALRSMRPWTQTLAVVSEPDYLPGLLHALGA